MRYGDQNDDIRTIRPTVAMTTKEILVAAKGEINSDNRPDQGPDTPSQTTFYTVFSHPDPQEDPTPAVVLEAPELAISANAGQITITWEGGATLMSADTLSGPFEVVDGAASPFSTPADQAAAFYILHHRP